MSTPPAEFDDDASCPCRAHGPGTRARVPAAPFADAQLDGPALLYALIGPTGPLHRRTALVSAFGAESVVLLHMAAQIDPALPVIFLDTGRHFPRPWPTATSSWTDWACTDIRTAYPDPALCGAMIRHGRLFTDDPDFCCEIRKTLPLAEELAGSRPGSPAASASRAACADLEAIELDGTGRFKLNPLATWDADRIETYRVEHGLPAHPLLAQGYRSIGCAACTRPAAPDEDPRRALVRHRQDRVRHPPAGALRRE